MTVAQLNKAKALSNTIIESIGELNDMFEVRTPENTSVINEVTALQEHAARVRNRLSTLVVTLGDV